MSRILVIDDSRTALETVARLLIDAGHQVAACLSARAATERLRRERFDLIVTDIFMPDMDGFEVILEQRRNGSGIPVIALSGARMARSALRAAELMGARRILEKSRVEHDLAAAVADTLAVAAPAPAPGERGAGDS